MMKARVKERRFSLTAKALLVCLAALLFLLFGHVSLQNGGGRYEVKASASAFDAMEVSTYDVQMDVQTDRTVRVKERITVTFLTSYGTMFYRSLPTEGGRYSEIQATCEGNSDFYYYVADNPDMDGFIDINCVGGVRRGRTWTYELSYVMQDGTGVSEKGMYIDVIGYGWSVPLHNVTVAVNFPAALKENPVVYSGGFGAETNEAEVMSHLSADRKTLTLYAPILNVVFNDVYYESMAEGITVGFVLPDGTLKGYTSSRIFTPYIWILLVVGGLVIALAIVVRIFTRSSREIIPIVNVNPPEGMDPLKMGKWLDGTADSEDITSMIYYFADKGYLKIDLENQDDPKLISMVDCLPDTASAHEKTLFNGIFGSASVCGLLRSASEDTDEFFGSKPSVNSKPNVGGVKEIHVSKMASKLYESSQQAIKQVPELGGMYETKSIFGFLSGCFMAILLGFLVPFFMGMKLGGGYKYWLGIIFVLPIVGMTLIAWIRENYRYKWKPNKQALCVGAEVLLAVIFGLLFVFAFANHVMTEWEKAVLCIAVFGACMITQNVLSRTERYMKTLGDILGFKEFITVTEEDKIKVMLEENPELYYHVLPYAQVLGVTDEWEEKFKHLVMEPPTWYVGGHLSVFDYLIIHRCMRRSMSAALASARQSIGGGHIGRSGGGGSFGGFGGGGFGGGGGGVR